MSLVVDQEQLLRLLETAFRAGYAANTGCSPDCKPATQAWERFKATIV